ncbi:hypothetical protein C8J57DRAFT_1368244 [Mycena rebaudengoi]|nr:hypothetical protein C8J57DRAFT_1368244 [Mycena rebaudengoi]
MSQFPSLMRFIDSTPSRLRVKSLFGVPKREGKSIAPSAPVELLPANLLQEIAGHISDLEDVLHFSLTMRERLLSRLYAHVDLKTNKQCKTLSALAKRPDVVRHIRKLAVRPNNTEGTLPEEPIDEASALHTFLWDGLEMPDDQLWLKLRKFSPNLANIGTTVGEEPLDSASNLYAFRNLRTFSFVVKCVSLEWLADGRPSLERLPKRFWQMLIEHCPHLEELTIGGAAPCPRLFDIRPVSYGQWPRLRSLTLGDLVMQVPRNNADARKEPSFMAFLRSHPGLRCLKMQHVGGDTFPASLKLPPAALPRLRSFSGPLPYVRSLPQPWLIQDLSLTGLQHSTNAFPRLFASLQELTALTSLQILIDLSFFANVNRGLQPRDHGKVFRSLLASCPRLLHLDLLCFTQPTFNVAEFSAALSDSPPQLRSFILTKVHSSTDEDMIQSATQLARQNPALDRFTLRFSQDSWLTSTGIRPKYIGIYEVVRDENGVSIALSAHERGVKSFGYYYSRRFQHKIPAQAPQRRPSLMRIGRSRSSASAKSSKSSGSSRSFSSFGL